MTEHAHTPELVATTRTTLGKKVSQLRRAGQLPVVAYGHKKTPQALAVDSRQFAKLYQAVGSSTLVNLKVDGGAAVKVLIHGVQLNSVSNHYLHADLYEVNLKEKLRTTIPLVYVGTADAVEVLGGAFIAVKDEVEVECLPDKLVSQIEVDISVMRTFEDALHLSDVVVPEGIEVLDDLEQVIAQVAAPRSDEELAALDEAIEEKAAEVPSETASGTDTPVEGEETDEKKEE